MRSCWCVFLCFLAVTGSIIIMSPAASNQPQSPVMSATIIHQRFCLKLDLLLKIFNIISVSSGTRVDHVLEKGKYLNTHLEQSSSWKSARKSWKSCHVPQHVFCRVAFELRLIIPVSSRAGRRSAGGHQWTTPWASSL